MGAESSILDGCDLDEAIEDVTICPWVIRHGQLADDTPITILSDRNSDRTKRDLFRRNVNNLKKLRHPSIVKFLASGDQSNHTYIVAERVVPIVQILDNNSPIEICAGLFSLLEGLSFLHEKAGMCHNNVCLESVYVTEMGQWKIGSFEYACKFSEATADYLKSTKTHRSPKSVSPEEKEGKIKNPTELAFARDVHAFAVLAEELLEKLDDLGDLTKTFELRIQDECLNPDPKARPKLQTLLNDRLFRNDFISISRFLQDITLKSEEEKKGFFEEIMDRLVKIPEETIGKCLCRLLLSRFVLLDESAKRFLLPSLLVPNRNTKSPKEATPLFSVMTYKTYMIPEIYRVFHCHDYHIRMILLTYFSEYVDLFEKEKLEETILPQVLLGLRDTNEDLTALSLKCLGDLVPLLGRQMVIGGQCKTYFKRGMPKLGGKSVSVKNEEQRNGEPVFCSVDSVMGKPLLKDLAKLSKNHTVADREIEAERKKKEREQRMLEAKLKREKRRQEKLLKSEKISVSQSDENILNGSNEVNVNIVDDYVESSISIQQIHNKEQRQDHIQPEVRDSDASVPDEEYCVTEDKDPDDWSNWETENAADDIKNPKDHDDDYLDMLNSENVMNSKKTESLTTNSEISDWNSDWTMDNSSSPKYDNLSKSKQSSSALSLISTKKLKPPSNTTPLGSEFDIMEIEVKKIKAEKEIFDFFADMTPEIKTNSNNKLPDLGVGGDKWSTTNKLTVLPEKKSTSLSMVYKATESDDVADDGGWGDDVNWDDNEF